MTRSLLGIAVIVAALPLSQASAQVRFDRTGYRLTSIGQQIRASARVAGGRQTAMRWRVADPDIASVSSQGVVEARKVGYTRLWAVAGEDSASALILVDQWAAKFDFVPAAVRLHTVGDRAPLRIQVRDAGGHVINGASPDRRATSACRSLNERVAVLADNQITARANGVTWIRCTDRAISDSVRVEVRQRAASIAILDKLGFNNRVVGDTFRIRVSAKDAAGGDIRDVQASWASLSPHVLSVDPLSGLARGSMGGTARIVAQVDDVTDTVSVTVLPGAGVPMIARNDTTPTGEIVLAEIQTPSLHLQPLYLLVDDTARVSPRDGTGAMIINADYRVTSADTSVVRTTSGQRVVGRASGNAYVFVQFGGIRDSMLVSVRERSADGVILAGDAVAAAPFVRPRYNLDSARVANRQRLDSATREIRRQSVVEIYTGRMLNVSAMVGHAAHATRDTNFLDRRTGIVYGAMADMAPFSRLKLSAAFRTGQLSPSGAGEDLSVTEVEADVMVRPTPWFGLAGGYVRRTTRTDIATQRWDFPRATASTRFSFVGGAVRTTTALSLLVGARYTGYLDAQQEPINPDPFSLSGEAGIELHSRRFAAGLSYYAERFSFPRVNSNTVSRRDQFSALRLRLGYQIGR